MKDFSYITNSHPSFIEGLYQEFLGNPEAVDPELRKFFEGFDFAMASGKAAANGGPNGQATTGTSSKLAPQNGQAQAAPSRRLKPPPTVLSGKRNLGHTG